MKKSARMLALVLFAASAFAAPSVQWRPGDGLQMRLSAADWPAVLEDLRSAHLGKKPYHVSKRTMGYDFDVRVLTPFARAAEYVQQEKGGKASPSFDEVSKRFEPGRLALQLKAVHRSQDAAEAVLAVLKTDSTTLQPYQDKILSSLPEKIGQYFEQYHVVVRDFYFDPSQLAGAKSLAVELIENDGTTLDLPLDLERLR